MYRNKKIRSITFVIASLGGGGAERVLSSLANYFSSQEIKINILYSMAFNSEPAYELNKNVNIHKLSNHITSNTGGFIEGKINTFLIIKHLRKKFIELDSDVIISFMDKTNIYTIIAHLGLEMPLIISERISYGFLQSKIWRIVRRLTYPFSNGMVVLSEYDYKKYSFVKNKKIIYNPIVFKKSNELLFEKKERMILAVGRLDKQKGFDILLESISKVDMQDWKLIILGEGPEKENLTHLIKEYNLEDKVFLLGRKDDVENYYNKASIFVLSSRFEGFPNALAEAMSFGCSCVSFDCKTGPSDIIENGKNGILIEEGNIDLLSSNIELLLNDSDLREKYFNEAIKIREKLNVENIAKEWEDYFEKLISK